MKGLWMLLFFLSGCVEVNNKKYYDNFTYEAGLSAEYVEDYKRKYKDFFIEKNKEYEFVRSEYDSKYGAGKGRVVFLREQKEYMTLNEYAEDRRSKYTPPEKSTKVEKEYCVYFISFFLPLNFWDFVSNESYIKRLLKEQNGSSIENILVSYNGVGSPFFSYECTKINGFITK